MKFEMKAVGLEDIIKRFDKLSNSSAEAALAKVVETYARKMAAEAAASAPILDGFLKGSLASSPQAIDKTTWTFGSDLPYALIQEYENATSKGFVRKALWNNRAAYREALKRQITQGS